MSLWDQLSCPTIFHGVSAAGLFPKSMLPAAGLSFGPVLSQPLLSHLGFPSVVLYPCCLDITRAAGRVDGL